MLDFFHHNEERPRKTRGWGFFWWSIVLMLMAGTCFASWVCSFYVIGHPEEPRCYRILKKLKKLDAPRRFEVTKAPEGKFLTPARLLERFGKLGPAHLERENAEMLRGYLMNYRESKTPPVYVTGRFEVAAMQELGRSDLFQSGAVALAQAKDKSQFLLECVFSAPAKTAPKILELLPVGSDIILERSHDVCALIHVERIPDGRMQFTAVPLSYGSWQIKKGGSFSLKSPAELENPKSPALNIDAGLPIIRATRRAQALASYSVFRRKLIANAGDDEAALVGPALVRFDPARSATESAPSPRLVQLPPQPPRLITNNPAPPRAVPTPAPAVPLPPRPNVRNMPPPDVPPPPAIRALTTSAASALVEKFDAAQRSVLTGDFVVTGVLGQRVAMRTLDSLRDRTADPAAPGTSAALIVVDFPVGKTPPGKNSTLTREAADGFMIRDVIRGANGQITIVAEGS